MTGGGGGRGEDKGGGEGGGSEDCRIHYLDTEWDSNFCNENGGKGRQRRGVWDVCGGWGGGGGGVRQKVKTVYCRIHYPATEGDQLLQ